MLKPELLAPAGGFEALVAAVENGADAVYLGGPILNARSSAINFTYEELSKGIKYAHLHGVKIYVTVNTLVADTEMESAISYLTDLWQMQVDAIIIQDLGLASLANRVLPELPLHASTQMTTHNVAGTDYLLQKGFKRIVLAREMSLDHINEIRKKTGAQLEVFVHGALCVGYSGQCLLSSMIGGRSGNRGRCAQPCRMAYSLVNEKGEEISSLGNYLLSPKDLNMSEYLPNLIKVGVSSFKIEGRMKRPEYVAVVVRNYRRLIDRAVKENVYQVLEEEKRELWQIFNRDFTTGYFFSKQGQDMMSYKRPNNRGTKLGRVKSFTDNNLVEISLEQPLVKGDGVEVWVSEGGRLGFEVNKILLKDKETNEAPTGSVIKLNIPGKVRLGDRLFKTHDFNLIESAKASFALGGRKKIPLDFKLSGGIDKPLVLEIKDELGNKIEALSAVLGQEALKLPLDKAYLKNQLGRLGNTDFYLANLEISLKDKVIYPAKIINEVRRKALEELENKRLVAYYPKKLTKEVLEDRLKKDGFFSKNIAKEKNNTSLAVSVGSLDALEASLKKGADIVYLDGYFQKGFKREFWQKGQALCQKAGVKFIIATPRITLESDLRQIRKDLEMWANFSKKPDGILAGNLAIVALAKEILPKVPIICDFGFNAFNQETLKTLLELPAKRVTLSPELTKEQIKRLAGGKVEVFVHGALELMISEYCLPGCVVGGLSSTHKCSEACKQGFGLKDRTGAIFPLVGDAFCRMHLFNSKDLCLLEDIKSLVFMGIDALRIEARKEKASVVGELVDTYRKVLDNKNQDISLLKEKLLKISSNGFTKGHFYRGVLEDKEKDSKKPEDKKVITKEKEKLKLKNEKKKRNDFKKVNHKKMDKVKINSAKKKR